MATVIKPKNTDGYVLHLSEEEASILNTICMCHIVGGMEGPRGFTEHLGYKLTGAGCSYQSGGFETRATIAKYIHFE